MGNMVILATLFYQVWIVRLASTCTHQILEMQETTTVAVTVTVMFSVYVEKDAHE